MKKHRLLKLVAAGAITAGAIYAYNQYVRSTAAKQGRLPADINDFYESSQGKLHYTKTGPAGGTPLILLHTLDPMSSSAEWENILPRLAADRPVYLLDLLGCGRSEKRRALTTNFIHVKAIQEFIRDMVTEGTPDIAAAGLSCEVALMLAAYAPDAVHELILINPPAVTRDPYAVSWKEKALASILSTPLIGEFIYNLLYSRSAIDKKLSEISFYNPFRDNDSYLGACYESAHLGDGHGRFLLASLVSHYLNMDCAHAISVLDHKALILSGEALEGAHFAARSWSELNSKITAKSITHTRGLPHVEAPEKTADAMRAFLAGADAASS